MYVQINIYYACIYVCVCTHTFTYVYTCIYAYIYIYIYIHIYLYVYVYISIHTRTYTYIYIYICVAWARCSEDLMRTCAQVLGSAPLCASLCPPTQSSSKKVADVKKENRKRHYCSFHEFWDRTISKRF